MPNMHFKTQIHIQNLISLLYNRFHTITVIMPDLQNHCSKEHLSTAPWCFLLVNFRLQIAYGKVRNSQIGVNKPVGKV